MAEKPVIQQCNCGLKLKAFRYFPQNYCFILKLKCIHSIFTLALSNFSILNQTISYCIFLISMLHLFCLRQFFMGEFKL